MTYPRWEMATSLRNVCSCPGVLDQCPQSQGGACFSWRSCRNSLHPQARDQTLAFLLLGLLFNFNSAFGSTWAGRWLAAWLPASRLGTVQQRLNIATERWLDRIAGAMFVGFGVLKLALFRADSCPDSP
jgi:hypothetical protein